MTLTSMILTAGCATLGDGGDDDPAAEDPGAEQCPSGQVLCGVCVDIMSDAVNCGTCGNVCQAGASCVAGACQCQEDRTSCGGICVSTASSAANCGACDVACVGQVCSAGACSDSCGLSETQCGQDCVDTTTDEQNCGACGAACQGGICEGGVCACSDGRVPCDGVCSDLTTSANCGTCGNACGLSEVCSEGSCVPASVGSGGGSSGGAGSGGGNTGGGSSGGAGSGGSGSGGSPGGDGIEVGGTCYPLCDSAASDPDGDGWGWENEASCVVVGSPPYQSGEPCGDGGGSGGSASGGAGTGGSGCSIEPANENTNATARNVLCFLHEIYGESVLSGQQDCHWSASPGDLGYINQVTGQQPAVVGGDILYDNAVSQATAAWHAGSLPMIRYHMGRPEDADSYESSLGTTDLADTLTPGTARYNGLMSKFDKAAGKLSQLQTAGAVVIWAPFHETQPNGWFWWSKGTGTQLKQLWQLMFDNFRNRGLNNLIWLFPFSGSPNAGYYPGPSVVDIAGPDTYASGQPFATMYNSTVSVVGNTMPIPLHETGDVVNPGDMFNNNQAPWVLFSVWCDTWLRENSNSALQNAYSHSRTLNRGDLPDFN